MSDLFSSSEILARRGGYKLDFFEMLNWGVFHGNIYHINCAEKSTLLTGKNGSGKTTLVDAIQTLLVPPQKRAYNSSSGTEIKRDRTEENYVLGASGEKIEDSYSDVTRERLRDKDTTISILLGCFKHTEQKRSITLFQVRYFTNENMQSVFAFSPHEIDISKIQDTLAAGNSKIDTSPNSRWKKILKEKFSVEFFTSFKQYSDVFSNEFGFKSDKALKLFSQIIGLKVLGGVSKFIKENMLEENNANEQYQQLYDNYAKLLTSEREIQKVKKQLELLEPVVRNSEKYKDAEKQFVQFNGYRNTLPIWNAKAKEKLLLQEQEKFENLLTQKTSLLNILSAEIKTLEGEIKSLENAIEQDNAGRRIKEIDSDISRLGEDIARIKKEFEEYRKRVSVAGIVVPKNEETFLRAKIKATELFVKNETEKTEIDKTKTDVAVSLRETDAKISAAKNELASLGSRNSNIPLENIRLRERIAKGVGCKENDLPFAGELLQVRREEKHWEVAIEKVLHNFALDILVQPKLYKKVTEFIKTNNLKGRVVYLKTEENFSFDVDFAHEQKNAENMLPAKIEVKENHELTKWISDYIKERFDYVCTDDTNEFVNAEKAVTSTGLLKNKTRHEKDDREKKSGRANFVLGWNNEEKRRAISAELDDLQTQFNNLQKKNHEIAELLSKIENICENLKRIQEYDSWQTIDSSPKENRIKQLHAEKKELLANSSKLKNLEKNLEIKSQEKCQKDENKNSLIKEIGAAENELKNLAEQIKQNDSILQPHFYDDEISKNTTLNISQFEAFFENDLKTKIDTLQMLEDFSTHFREKISSEIKEIDKRKEKYKNAIITAMNNVISPRERWVREKFGDWSNEFAHLECEMNYIDDFVATYEKLQKDDLPQYEEKFHEYLHETISAHFIDFSQYIKTSTEKITNAISTLNESLRNIAYEKNPNTYLELAALPVSSTDTRIKKFNSLLNKARPDAVSLANRTNEAEEKIFESIKNLIDYLEANETERNFVLDVRNWFSFAAIEKNSESGEQKRYYRDSSSLSGGQKTKLTYTIIAAALEYQFGLSNAKSRKSFCFAIIDEAFSKIDAENSAQVMQLFEQLGIQLMVVTPDDKINIAEDYVSSVHIVLKNNLPNSNSSAAASSSILSFEIDEYKNERAKNESAQNKTVTQDETTWRNSTIASEANR